MRLVGKWQSLFQLMKNGKSKQRLQLHGTVYCHRQFFEKDEPVFKLLCTIIVVVVYYLVVNKQKNDLKPCKKWASSSGCENRVDIISIFWWHYIRSTGHYAFETIQMGWFHILVEMFTWSMNNSSEDPGLPCTSGPVANKIA